MLKQINNYKNLITNVICEFPFASLYLFISAIIIQNSSSTNLLALGICGYLLSVIIEIISTKKDLNRKKYYFLNSISILILVIIFVFSNDKTSLNIINYSWLVFVIIFLWKLFLQY